MKRILLIMLLCLPSVFALEVSRTAPSQISQGDQFTVTITVTNDAQAKEVYVYEPFYDFFQQVDTDNFIVYDPIPGIIAPPPPHYQWILDLAANEVSQVGYSGIAIYPGEFTLYETQVSYDSTVVEAPRIVINVICNLNGNCEPDLHEGYFSCADCPSGSADGICDLVNDRVVDPDCAPGVDTGVEVDYCNNNVGDSGEEGIDCGGNCPNACLTLDDLTGGITDDIGLQQIIEKIHQWIDGTIELPEVIDAINAWIG